MRCRTSWRQTGCWSPVEKAVEGPAARRLLCRALCANQSWSLRSALELLDVGVLARIDRRVSHARSRANGRDRAAFLEEALFTMEQHHIKRLPVIEDHRLAHRQRGRSCQGVARQHACRVRAPRLRARLTDRPASAAGGPVTDSGQTSLRPEPGRDLNMVPAAYGASVLAGGVSRPFTGDGAQTEVQRHLEFCMCRIAA